MPYFVIPSRRLRQPQGAVRIDWSNCITAQLKAAWAFSSDFDAVANRKITIVSDARTVTEKGLAIATPTSAIITPTLLTSDASTLLPTGDCTAILYQRPLTNTAGYVHLCVGKVGSTGTSSFHCFAPFSDGNIYWRYGNETGISASYGATGSDDVVGLSAGPAGLQIWKNGVQLASGSNVTRTQAIANLAFGSYGDGDSAAAIRYAFYLFHRQLSDAEMASIGRNPWQIFAPDRRILYFSGAGTGGGPSSYSLTADPNTLTLLGIASSLRTSRLITANPSSLSFSGVSANTLMARKVLANPSSLSLSRPNANTLATRKTVASPGALTLSGSTATFVVGKILVANPGTLSFSGSLANLKREAILSAQPATLTLSGSIAGLFRGKILIADPAALTLTGQSAATTTIRILSASPSNLGLVGQNATLSLSGSVQKARPGSDISTGGWLPSSGSDLYAMLDETSYNDSDYIYSPNNPTTETAEVKFTSVIDPGVHTGHILRFRLAAVGLDTVFDVYLMQGATQIATWQKTVTAGNTVSYEETLTSGEASNITDYTDLRIKVVAHA